MSNIHDFPSWFTAPIELGSTSFDTVGETPGLRNPAGANLCYMNSSLQCLLHCKPFVAVLLKVKHKENKEAPFCAFCATRSVAQDFFESHERRRVAYAERLAQSPVYVNPEFSLNTQQDAHEFYISLLEKIVLAEAHGCTGAWGTPNGKRSERRKSLAKEVFSGEVTTIITCPKCENESRNSEEFNNLSLEVLLKSNKETKRIKSVKDALKSYTGKELLQGEDRYYCDICSKKVIAEKHVAITRAPNVLVLQLKRFSTTVEEGLGSKTRKENHPIAFTRKLDLEDYMHGKPESLQAKYKLSSFLIHKGDSPERGHYHAWVSLQESDGKPVWWSKDDSIVARQNHFYNKANVYLLFYTRIDKDPPKVGRSSKKKNHYFDQTATISTRAISSTAGKKLSFLTRSNRETGTQDTKRLAPGTVSATPDEANISSSSESSPKRCIPSPRREIRKITKSTKRRQTLIAPSLRLKRRVEYELIP